MVEFGGCSGRPHVLGSVGKRCVDVVQVQKKDAANFKIIWRWLWQDLLIRQILTICVWASEYFNIGPYENTIHSLRSHKTSHKLSLLSYKLKCTYGADRYSSFWIGSLCRPRASPCCRRNVHIPRCPQGRSRRRPWHHYRWSISNSWDPGGLSRRPSSTDCCYHFCARIVAVNYLQHIVLLSADTSQWAR